MTGAGPSRRSHTKSRTGCRTCKKRHIRCDETTPQCRNCTKHQVRCDYMADSPSDSTAPSPRSSYETPRSDLGAVDAQSWRQTGIFPFPALVIDRLPDPDQLTDTELGLLCHLCAICNEMKQAGTSALTMWTERIPKFVSLASLFPFVLHALCAFSATHLAWRNSSSELRDLQAEHGVIALRGLHEAIGAFSQSNASAILAASMLMSWQATDWSTWSSLTSGTYSVLTAMSTWSRDQFLADYFPCDGLTTSSFRAQPRMPLAVVERVQVLQRALEALTIARRGLVDQEMELYWIDQLIAYVGRLRQTNPAQSPEAQFEHAYMLRKWAFWVPISLLQRDAPKGPSMIALAQLYATTMSIQPLFPDLLTLFQSVLVRPPLETLIDLTESMSQHHDHEISEMMYYARQASYNHSFSHAGEGQSIARQDSTFASHDDDQYHELINITDLSAGSVPLHSATVQAYPGHSPSGQLAVPMDVSGFSYGISTWGLAPSPGFPPQDFGADFPDASSPDLLDPTSHSGSTLHVRSTTASSSASLQENDAATMQYEMQTLRSNDDIR